MANWSESTKHLPSEINYGKQYEKGDRVSREQLNALAENSFYAVKKSDEALAKANSAYEANGTLVTIGGINQLNWSADFVESEKQRSLGEDGAIVHEKQNQNKAETNANNLTTENIANWQQKLNNMPRVTAGGTISGKQSVVVESYLSSDGLTWYRIWSDGWKECGGTLGSAGTLADRTITIPIPSGFSTVYYNVAITGCWQDNTGKGNMVFPDKTTTTFRCHAANFEQKGTYYACGY